MDWVQYILISLNFYALLFVYLYTPIGYPFKKAVFNRLNMWQADTKEENPRLNWWVKKIQYLAKCAFCQSFWFLLALTIFTDYFHWAWVFPCALMNLALDKILLFTNTDKRQYKS